MPFDDSDSDYLDGLLDGLILFANFKTWQGWALALALVAAIALLLYYL